VPNTLPSGDMDHNQIEEQNLAEQYVMGKLSAEESGRFEDHFVDCPQCLDQLETAERIRAALKTISSEVPSRAPAAPAFAVRHAAWTRAAWLIAAALVMAIAIAAVLAIRLAQIGRELERTKIASLDWQHRYDAQRSNSAEHRPPAADEPVVGPTFYLATTRGGDAGDPGTRVTVPARTRWVILALDRELEPEFQSLRASLKTSSGREVWRQDSLPAESRTPLSFAVPAELLAAGGYVLTIEGLVSNGGYRPAGRYRFQVTRNL